MHFSRALALSLACLATTVPVSANGSRDAEIKELRARLDRLEQEAAAEKAAREKAAAEEQKKKAEPPKDAAIWSFKDGRPSVRSAGGAFELSFRGAINFDVAAYEQDQGDFGLGYGPANNCAATNTLCDLGSGALFRRVRFGVEGRFFKDFIYELRFEFGGSDVEDGGTINLARVGYVGVPGLRVHAGALEPIMTLAAATSNSELATMERAGVISTIAGVFGAEDSRRGIEATYQKEGLLQDGDNFMISAALTGNKTTGRGGCSGAGHSGGASVDDECSQLFGRVAYRLWSDGVSNVQVGGSAGTILSLQGTAPGVDRTVRFRERPEVRVSGERFVDTGDIPSTGGTFYGFEAGANWQNLYLAGEWCSFGVERDVTTVGGADPRFSGWYVEGEWIVTGEAKRYVAGATNNNVAVWRGPSIASPLGGSDGFGALGLSARYSVLDLNWREGAGGVCVQFLECIRGGEQSIANVGLNWYINTNLKLMAEFAWVDIERMTYPGLDLDAEFNVVQGRLQFGF
jgi:phosphate-selective porin OprO/OprP